MTTLQHDTPKMVGLQSFKLLLIFFNPFIRSKKCLFSHQEEGWDEGPALEFGTHLSSRVTLGHFHPCEQTQAGGWTDLTILFSFSILGMLFVIREIKWESKSATELYKLIVLVLFSVMRKHLLFLKRQSPIKSIKHQTL